MTLPGKMIEQALCKKVAVNENIEVYEQTVAVELLVNSKCECKGVVVFNDITQEYETIYSPCIILATGGIGQLYKYTTNPSGATGDGLLFVIMLVLLCRIWNLSNSTRLLWLLMVKKTDFNK